MKILVVRSENRLSAASLSIQSWCADIHPIRNPGNKTAGARDFAKLGRLYLNHGNWNGKQIVSRSWVEHPTTIETTEGSPCDYQYNWWIGSKEHGDLMAQGHLGQFVYVNPQKRLAIVRVGKSNGDLDAEEWKNTFVYLSEKVH